MKLWFIEKCCLLNRNASLDPIFRNQIITFTKRFYSHFAFPGFVCILIHYFSIYIGIVSLRDANTRIFFESFLIAPFHILINPFEKEIGDCSLFHVEIEAYCLLPLHRDFGDMIEGHRNAMTLRYMFDVMLR